MRYIAIIIFIVLCLYVASIRRDAVLKFNAFKEKNKCALVKPPDKLWNMNEKKEIEYECIDGKNFYSLDNLPD